MPGFTEHGKTATNVSGGPPQNFHPTDKALLIIVNTSTKPKCQLGAGPVTDSLVVVQQHVKCGFKAFFYIIPEQRS
jgi:hypothetical protein